MSASKMIFRQLIVTVTVILAAMFVYGSVIMNGSSATLRSGVSVPGMNVEQEDAGVDSGDDIGDVLDSVEIDYAA